MLVQRVLTVAVLLPLFLTPLFLFPNVYWGLLLVGVVILAGREWSALSGYSERGSIVYCAVLAASCGVILWWGQHSGDARSFVFSAPGKLLYGGAALFWFAIVPLWLAQGWKIRG